MSDVAKLSADGTSLLAASYLGAYGAEAIEGIMVDSNGNFAVSGNTESAGFPVTPGRFEVMIHDTVWPFVSEAVVKFGLFVPTFVPFTCHWYVGVDPPLKGVATNIAESPGHCGCPARVPTHRA